MSFIRYLPRYWPLERELCRRDEFCKLAKPERDSYRLMRLNHQWSLATSGSAYYRELASHLRLPHTFGSIEEFHASVPETSKRVVRDNPDMFRLAGHRRGFWLCTGGSTGFPTRVFWSLEGHLENVRDQYWARMWWGVGPFDPQAMLWGHSHVFGRGIKGRIKACRMRIIDLLRARKRFSAYRLDDRSLRDYFDRMQRFGPKSVYAYASAGYLLALANLDRRWSAEPLSAFFLAAEPVLPRYREEIRNVFGCPSVGEYGSIECGMLAYEHPTGLYQVFENSVIIETVPAAGGGFKILVTQLRDTGFPLFRYDIGDLSTSPLMRNDHGMEAIADVQGRSHDLIHRPEGGACHAEVLTHILEQYGSVIMFTAHQNSDYSLSIILQTGAGRSLMPSEEDEIIDKVRRVLGSGVKTDISCVRTLPQTVAGKHRWITSDIEAQG